MLALKCEDVNSVKYHVSEINLFVSLTVSFFNIYRRVFFMVEESSVNSDRDTGVRGQRDYHPTYYNPAW